jgi:hypothetical protein
MPQGTELEDSAMAVSKANGSSRLPPTRTDLLDDDAFQGFGDTLEEDLEEGFDDDFEEDFDEDFNEDFEEEFEDEWDKVATEWTEASANPRDVNPG